VKSYIASLFAGLLAGAIYALIGQRSPAPPVVALIGLLGMLIGDQGGTLVKRALRGEPVRFDWFGSESTPSSTEIVSASKVDGSVGDGPQSKKE
jgi:XapX domain-containing protein